MYMNTAFDKVCFKGSVVSQSARFVYLCLCKHADNTKQTCFPSLSRIAQIVGKSISTIKRAVRELCRYGAIKRAPRFRKDGGQTSNLYEIVECDFEKLVEIPENKEERETKNKANYTSEIKLDNQVITQATTIDDISFSVSDNKFENQFENSCTVEDNEIMETKDDKPFAEKQKDSIQKDNTAVQQEEINEVIKEDESKALHNKLENNSVNPINVMNENVDEAEHIYINEKAKHEVHQDQLKMIVNPTLKNSNQTYNTKPDDEQIETNSDSLKDLITKKSFRKVIKPIFYIISVCKSRFLTKLNWGKVTGDPPRTYPFN